MFFGGLFFAGGCFLAFKAFSKILEEVSMAITLATISGMPPVMGIKKETQKK